MIKIMIIEDDPNIQNMLFGKLKQNAYNVVATGDGEKAIGLFKKEKPDLILIDLILPKKSGFEIIEEIRIKHHSKTPIIVLSNLDQTQDRETAMRLGVNDYIVKSNVSLSMLISRIAQLIDKNKH